MQDIRLWPRESNCLCWHCCHHFDQIPVFMPLCSPTNPDHIVLHGIFCSWNCVKAYVFYSTKNKRTADTVHLISLLSFLTYHRPIHCPNPSARHSFDCPCLELYHGIIMADKKETLVSFGGNQSIEQYRKNFMMVKDLSMLYRCFPHDKSNMNTICETPRLRRFTYCFDVNMKEPAIIQDKTKTKEDVVLKPVVHKRIVKHKSLFD